MHYRCRFGYLFEVIYLLRLTLHRMAVRIVANTYVLRRSSMFDGFFTTRSRWIKPLSKIHLYVTRTSGKKGRRHCLPNASIMIHRTSHYPKTVPNSLKMYRRTIRRCIRSSIRHSDPRPRNPPCPWSANRYLSTTLCEARRESTRRTRTIPSVLPHFTSTRSDMRTLNNS